MSTLPEFVGTIHIFLGPYRGNPIALYLRQDGDSCRISPNIYPWNRFVGEGETVNKAAADFDAKWKEGDLDPDMYSGPHWEGGIKPEKPKPPPKPAATPKPATGETAKTETAHAATSKPATAEASGDSPTPRNEPTDSPTTPKPPPASVTAAPSSGSEATPTPAEAKPSPVQSSEASSENSNT